MSIVRLDQVLRSHAERTPEAVALRYVRSPLAGRELSWAALDSWADASATRLLAAGAEYGAVCAVVLDEHPGCIAAIFGVLRAGGVLVTIDARWGDTAIASVLQHAGARYVFARPAEGRRLAGLVAPETELLSFTTTPCTVPRVAIVLRDPDDVALIAFTSGTTAGPKGVMLTHRNFHATYEAIRKSLPEPRPRRFGSVFRLAGLGDLGHNYFLAHWCGASTVVLPEITPNTARSFWRVVVQEGVDFIYLVPSLVRVLNRVARAPENGARVACVTAASPISPEAMDRFQERFGALLLNWYGLTELGGVVFYGERDRVGRGTESIGKPTAADARLLSEDGTLVEGEGQGRLQIKGAMVSPGYWRNPSANAAGFDGEWLDTGDLARRDARDCYYILGRTKETVLKGGSTLYLAEVDEALLAHPEIADAAAVAVEDSLYGEDVAALVRTTDGASLGTAAIRRWCAERLGASRAPRRVVMSPDPLPRNSAGKIVRREVKQRYLAAIQDT